MNSAARPVWPLTSNTRRELRLCTGCPWKVNLQPYDISCCRETCLLKCRYLDLSLLHFSRRSSLFKCYWAEISSSAEFIYKVHFPTKFEVGERNPPQSVLTPARSHRSAYFLTFFIFLVYCEALKHTTQHFHLHFFCSEASGCFFKLSERSECEEGWVDQRETQSVMRIGGVTGESVEEWASPQEGGGGESGRGLNHRSSHPLLCPEQKLKQLKTQQTIMFAVITVQTKLTASNGVFCFWALSCLV